MGFNFQQQANRSAECGLAQGRVPEIGLFTTESR
jgi:hypothetical protein